MTDPKDSGEWPLKGPALDESGKLVGQKPAVPAPRPSLSAPKREEPLELDLSKKVPPSGAWSEPAPYRDDYKAPLKRIAALKAAAALAALALVALGVFMLFPRLQRDIPWRLPGGASRSLLITSDPSGADVRINGGVVGQTPFAADNHWVGHVQVEVRMEGFDVFRDTFEGSHETHIVAKLKKKP